jgi:hypothetical protein
MIRFLKELYLTGYVFFYRASGRSWSHQYNVAKGVAGVSLFVFLAFTGIEVWIEILMGKQSLTLLYFARWYRYASIFAWLLANYYILVSRGYGVRFEKDFDNLKKSTQTFLQVICCLVQVASVALFIFSGLAYRHVFHVVAK